MAAEAPESAWQRQYREDAVVLGELGSVLMQMKLPSIEVRLPRRLGEAAVAAWEREDNDGPLDPETFEQVQRHRGGTLALNSRSALLGRHFSPHPSAF